jgi:hypothetical protein
MTLFAKDDMLSLNEKIEFLKMLQKLHDYSTTINSSAEPFQTAN